MRQTFLIAVLAMLVIAAVPAQAIIRSDTTATVLKNTGPGHLLAPVPAVPTIKHGQSVLVNRVDTTWTTEQFQRVTFGIRYGSGHVSGGPDAKVPYWDMYPKGTDVIVNNADVGRNVEVSFNYFLWKFLSLETNAMFGVHHSLTEGEEWYKDSGYRTREVKVMENVVLHVYPRGFVDLYGFGGVGEYYFTNEYRASKSLDFTRFSSNTVPCWNIGGGLRVALGNDLQTSPVHLNGRVTWGGYNNARTKDTGRDDINDHFWTANVGLEIAFTRGARTEHHFVEEDYLQVDTLLSPKAPQNIDCFRALAVGDSIRFPFAEYIVLQRYLPIIDAVGDALMSDCGAHVSIAIEGRTDQVDTDAYNLRLGKKRSEEVKWLIVKRKHVNPDRIRTTTLGETQLLVDEDGWKGWIAAPGSEDLGYPDRCVMFWISMKPWTGEK